MSLDYDGQRAMILKEVKVYAEAFPDRKLRKAIRLICALSRGCLRCQNPCIRGGSQPRSQKGMTVRDFSECDADQLIAWVMSQAIRNELEIFHGGGAYDPEIHTVKALSLRSKCGRSASLYGTRSMMRLSGKMTEMTEMTKLSDSDSFSFPRSTITWKRPARLS